MKKSWSRAVRDKRHSSNNPYPIGTIAFYGPDDKYASKVAVSVQAAVRGPVDILERWYDRGVDVRVDPKIGDHVVAFLRRHGVRRTVVADRIIGCPHEEGVDYADGGECPMCPWWHGRDRWTGELLEGGSRCRS